MLASVESKTSLSGLSSPPQVVRCSRQTVAVMLYLHRIIQGNRAGWLHAGPVTGCGEANGTLILVLLCICDRELLYSIISKYMLCKYCIY